MIICDVDGVIVREDGTFHPLLGMLLAEVDRLGGEVVFLTARAESPERRAQTMRELKLARCPETRLLMRPFGRAREKPSVWKAEKLQEIVARTSLPVTVIDDDHDVLRSAVSLGCAAVHPRLGRRRS